MEGPMIEQCKKFLYEFQEKRSVDQLTNGYALISKINQHRFQSGNKFFLNMGNLVDALGRNINSVKPDLTQEFIDFFLQNAETKKFEQLGLVQKLFQVMCKYATSEPVQNFEYCQHEDIFNEYSQIPCNQCIDSDVQKFYNLNQSMKTFVKKVSFQRVINLVINDYSYSRGKNAENWKYSRWILHCICVLTSKQLDFRLVNIFNQLTTQMKGIRRNPKTKYAIVEALTTIIGKYKSCDAYKKDKRLQQAINQLAEVKYQDEMILIDKFILYAINSSCIVANMSSIRALSNFICLTVRHPANFNKTIQLCAERMMQLGNKFKETQREEFKLVFNMYFDQVLNSIIETKYQNKKVVQIFFNVYENYNCFLTNPISIQNAWRLFCLCNRKSQNWTNLFESVISLYDDLKQGGQSIIFWVDTIASSIRYLRHQAFFKFQELVRNMTDALICLRGDDHEKGQNVMKQIFNKVVPQNITAEDLQNIKNLYQNEELDTLSQDHKIPQIYNRLFRMSLLCTRFEKLMDKKTIKEHQDHLKYIISLFIQVDSKMGNQMQQENEEGPKQEMLYRIFEYICTMIQIFYELSEDKPLFLKDLYEQGYDLIDTITSYQCIKSRTACFILHAILSFREICGYEIFPQCGGNTERGKQFHFVKYCVKSNIKHIKKLAIETLIVICNQTPARQFYLFTGTRRLLKQLGLQDRIQFEG